MYEPSPDLNKLAAKLAASEEFTHKRMGVEVLDGLVKFLGRELDIKMIPGSSFDYDSKTRQFIYDRNLLLSMPPEAAPGLTFHNMGHARYSQTELNVRSVCTSLATAVNRKFPATPILQTSIAPLMEAAEDERMEARLRRRYRNLGSTYMPRCDKGWRAPHFLQKFTELQELSTAGALDSKGRSVYWNRVATAVRGLVSGAMTQTHLPKDMPWDENLCAKVAALRKKPTVNEMIRAWKDILPDMVRARQEYLEQDPPPPPQPAPDKTPGQYPPPPQGGPGSDEGIPDGLNKGEGNGEGNEGYPGGCGGQDDEPDDQDDEDDEDLDDKLQGGGEGDETPDDEPDDDPDDEPGKEESQDPLQRIKDEAEKQPSPTQGDVENEIKRGAKEKAPVKFVSSGKDAGFVGLGTVSLDNAPAWSAVRDTVANIIGPIRKKVQNAFKENEIANKSRGWKSGRLDSKALIRAHLTGSDRIYTRRDEAGQLSYGVYLLVDISGSMANGQGDIKAFGEVFRAFHCNTSAGSDGEDMEDYYRRGSEEAYATGYAVRGDALRKKADKILNAPRVDQTKSLSNIRTRRVWETGRGKYHDEVVGEYGTRQQLACRMVVAITEALKAFPEINTAIGAYSCGMNSRGSGYYQVKEFDSRLSARIKEKVLARLLEPDGGTVITPALQMATDRLRRLKVNKKVLIVLTDGAFGDNMDSIQAAINEMTREQIEMVVLTVGCSTREAESFIPARNCAQVNDDTIGQELGKHLRRMAKGGK